MSPRSALEQRARELLRDALVVDLHVDALLPARWARLDPGRRHRPLPLWPAFGHVDLPRLREGGVDAVFLGIVTAPRPWRGAFRSALAQLELLDALARRLPGLRPVRTAEELLQARAEGAVAALTGLEGAHALEGDPDKLELLAARGLAYLGLAHFSSHRFAPCAHGWRSSNRAPLPEAGRELVARAQELGVLVDLAHLGRQAALDACALSRAPLLVSHTGLAALHPHWRNADDELLRAVAETDGVVGVIFARRFLGGGGLDAVVASLEHLRRSLGVRHAALGSDWDGAVVPGPGLEDPTHLPGLVAALLERGWPEADVRAVLGENALRVLRAGRAAARRAPRLP